MNRKEICCANACWHATFSATSGDIISLADVATGVEHVYRRPPDKEEVAEGGHEKPTGLLFWIKAGEERDANTGVLSAFAPIQAAARTITPSPSGLQGIAVQDGLTLKLDWNLPAGKAPLRFSAELKNQSAEPECFQFEGFYRWAIDAGVWAQTAYAIPGREPRWLYPFGELYFVRGGEANSPACYWQTGTGQGVVIRPLDGVHTFFIGVQGRFLIMGPHSEACRLMPGESLSIAFEIAPLSFACKEGWLPERTEAEAALQKKQVSLMTTAERLGGVETWCRHEPPVLSRRALHLTFQYAPVDKDAALRLIEKVAIPAGFNELHVEVDRNFQYRSHPRVSPDWAWSEAQWKSFIREVNGLGLPITPLYNALGHQTEAGLAPAYPELAEDPGCWCLNPQHPKTRVFLGEIFQELLDTFEPEQFHLGLDEIDVPSRPPTFALPKPGRTGDGGELLAEHINGLHDFLKRQNVKTLMWADMLLYRPEHCTIHGLRSNSWRAIDKISREITMVDWVYHVHPDFGGSRYLQKKGFPVMGATWHTPQNIYDFAAFAAQNNLVGMMHTTWCPPRMEEMGMACLLLAGKYFQTPGAPRIATTLPEAESLAFSLIKGSL